MIDLEHMSLPELEELQRQVQAEICRRRSMAPPPRVALARFAASVRERAA